MSRVTKIGAVLAIVAVGIGIGILVERGSSGDARADTAEARYLIPTDESPSPETAAIIRQFSILEEPTLENLSELSEEDRHWIRDGLFQTRDGNPEVTAVGRVETEHADVLVFTTNDEMCLYSSARRELIGELTSNCYLLRRALPGWVSGFRQYGFERRGYVVAVLPDRVSTVGLSKPVGKVKLNDNVVEGLTRVKDFVIQGRDGDAIVTRTTVPLRAFWSDVRYP